MLERWHNFYIMVGGSSTGLIGLLFVVVTLSAASEATSGRVDLTRGHSVYASPATFHLGVVFLVVIRSHRAASLLAAVIICLLLTAINNAWDIAAWLAHPARKAHRRGRIE